jgi:hypothetical protein
MSAKVTLWKCEKGNKSERKEGRGKMRGNLAKKGKIDTVQSGKNMYKIVG